MMLPSQLHPFFRDDKVALFNTRSMKVYYVDRRSFDTGRPLALPSSLLDSSPSTPPVPSLHVIQVSVTNCCNLRCAYCVLFANGGQHGADAPMSLSLAASLTPEINETLPSGGLLYLTGGEPLTNWSVVRALLDGAKESLTKLVITNGTLVTDSIANALAATHTHVLISSDGPPDINDRFRRTAIGEPTAQKIRDGYSMLRRAGVSVGVSVVIGEHNQACLADTVEYLIDEFGPDSIGVGLPHYTKHFRSAIDTETIANQYLAIFELQKRKPLFVDQIARRLQPFVEERFRYRDCSACGGKVVIFPDGRRSNCISAGPSPDLRRQSDEFEQRIPFRLLDCAECHAIGICGGGCVYDGQKLFNGVDRRNCLITKRLLERFVWDLYDRSGEVYPTRAVKTALYRSLIERHTGTSFSVGHTATEGNPA